MDGLQFFDRQQDFTVAWKTLPHWSQAGTVCFITWRTADSLPQAARERIGCQRAELMARWGLDPHGDWAAELAKRSAGDAARVRSELFDAWDRQLDLGAGECVLARPELSAIVESSLRHFDGERYVLTDAMVMPNHVHVLAAFADADGMMAQVTSWKRFTAGAIQRALGRRGEFWQVEQFDHLVRSLEQFERFRRYLRENPRKAGLREGAFRGYSKEL